jgi:branched-chain amino acid aminotransferase
MKTRKHNGLPFAFFEGSIVPLEQANVSVMTNALQYGIGWFGGIRGYYNKEKGFLNIFRLDDHIKRFISSSRILGVDFPYTPEEMKKHILDLTKKNAPKTDVYFRPFGYAASLQLGPNLNRENSIEFALYMITLGDYLPTDKGLKTKVSSWRRISDNTIPPRAKISGGYVNSALARKEADDHGCDEAIFLTEDGYVCEGSAENIFIVRDGMIITPSHSSDILEGITRRTVFALAEEFKIPVIERPVNRTELYVADEAFFSGTGVQIAWIAEVDGRKVGGGTQGPVSKKLQKAFFEIVKGNNEKYKDWNTKVTV